MHAADTTAAYKRTAVTVEANTSAPNELTALTSTTVLVASHATNCDSFNDLESAVAEDAEQETNV